MYWDTSLRLHRHISTTLESSAWNFASASLHSALLGQAGASATTLLAALDLPASFLGAALGLGAGFTRTGVSAGSSSLANKSTSSDASVFSSVCFKINQSWILAHKTKAERSTIYAHHGAYLETVKPWFSVLNTTEGCIVRVEVQGKVSKDIISRRP